MFKICITNKNKINNKFLIIIKFTKKQYFLTL